MFEADVDAIVIGAGVVGAACARSLSSRGLSVMVLEAEQRVGGYVSERNSGVLHAGIYYPADSLKTELCIAGNRGTRTWCERMDLPWEPCGKLVVATSSEDEEHLQPIADHAKALGIVGVRWLTASELVADEPAVRGVAALLVPTSAMVDPVELVRSYIAAAEADGAMVLTAAKVSGIEELSGGYRVDCARGPVCAPVVINAAGLESDRISAMVGVNDYTIYPCRGDYFRVKKPLGFKRLVYPVKRKGWPGLGVHYTRTMGNELLVGPDTEWVDERYCGDARPEKIAKFAESASRLVRAEITVDDLSWYMCSVRPKLRAPDESVEKDFVVQEDKPGFWNLVGIESPGLTSAWAIGEHVAGQLA